MSAFRALKAISKSFEEELTRASNELFAARTEEPFEDMVANKLRDLSLYSAKLKLLRAKPLSVLPQVSEVERDEDTVLEAYGETVANRIIEQTLVKSASQTQAVRALVSAPDSTLDPEMIERKKKILEAISAYTTQEALVQYWDGILKEKEKSLAEVRLQWDQELSMLRDVREEETGPQLDNDDPLYQKLSSTVSRLETMRWLAGRLGVPRRRGYDWLADPGRRLRALKLAREPHSVSKMLVLSDN